MPYGIPVAVHPATVDRGGADLGNDRMPAPLLTCGDVGEVDLDRWDVDGLDGVANRI